MGLENRRYLEIPIADVTDQMIRECIETSRDTLVKSDDLLLTVLKWDDSDGPPDSIKRYLRDNPTRVKRTLEDTHIERAKGNWVGDA